MGDTMDKMKGLDFSEILIDDPAAVPGGYDGWPTGRKYNVIYADPPWAYKDAGHLQKPGYPTQSLSWICNLPVADIAAPDCCLIMWAVSPMLDDAFKVISAWGFKYKTVAYVWSKRCEDGRPRYNLGQWTMGNVEMCLLATRGKPNQFRQDKSVKQLVEAPRGRHSAKPAEVRRRIESLFGDLPRIELFARERVPGWDAWGNEV